MKSLGLIIFLSFSVFAQDQLELSAIRKLEDGLPTYSPNPGEEGTVAKGLKERKYHPPKSVTQWEKIANSGNELGAVPAGYVIVRINDNKSFKTGTSFYVKFYRHEDEHGFKYLINKDGSCTYKINGDYVEPFKEELALYEPPLTYTPAPTNITRTEYDQKLSLLPEAVFYAGFVDGSFMKDLLNDSKARVGTTTQFGAHLFTDWKLPVKAGAAIHYEKATYNMSGGNKFAYHAWSFGPQFKTKDFDIRGKAIRLQTQFRVSPFAEAQGDTKNGPVNFKFNSADLLTSLEHPISNHFGQFVLGFFFQAQWLNLKNQTEIVSIKASNQINKSLGFSFAQVFD